MFLYPEGIIFRRSHQTNILAAVLSLYILLQDAAAFDCTLSCTGYVNLLALVKRCLYFLKLFDKWYIHF